MDFVVAYENSIRHDFGLHCQNFNPCRFERPLLGPIAVCRGIACRRLDRTVAEAASKRCQAFTRHTGRLPDFWRAWLQCPSGPVTIKVEPTLRVDLTSTWPLRSSVAINRTRDSPRPAPAAEAIHATTTKAAAAPLPVNHHAASAATSPQRVAGAPSANQIVCANFICGTKERRLRNNPLENLGHDLASVQLVSTSGAGSILPTGRVVSVCGPREVSCRSASVQVPCRGASRRERCRPDATRTKRAAARVP